MVPFCIDFDQEFFEEWHGRYKTASIATDDRAEQIAEVAKEVEVKEMTKFCALDG